MCIRDRDIDIRLHLCSGDAKVFVRFRGQVVLLNPLFDKQLQALQADIDILQLKIATDVTANPFSVTFESLDGLTVTGVWNADLARIEF